MSIDYEWLFSFPIPIEYTIWRSLHILYDTYRAYLRNTIREDEFVDRFGISKEYSRLFLIMENNFQKYVYGNEGHYMRHYKKTALMNNMRWWP